MDPEAGESIVLEEDIDENYDPTEEEILEYAQFLGMDLQKDRDLLYIAKEGLKAPLPDPWKPCQTHDGEIYYFNFETGESTWDHPCDEYYRKVYEKEKEKKNERQSQSKKMKSGGSPEANKQPANLNPITSKKQTKTPLLKLDELSKFNNHPKKDDPLLHPANEKKNNQYRVQKEKEVHQKIQGLQGKHEAKKKDLEKQQQKRIKELELEYEMKRTEEEGRIRKENKPIEEGDIPFERKKETRGRSTC